MPFIDRNGDQEHLAGGMTDELISRLREMEGLSVAGGDWMAGLLKEEGDPQSVGKRLSVTHLLEGGIRQDGKRLKISARLTSTGDGRLVWAEDYEKEVGDIFLVQDQIARAVAGSLSVVLDTGLQSTRYGGTANFEAYDHLLRGIALRHSRPPEKPIEQIRKALAIDPNYARAWFELTLALGGQLRIATTMDEQKQILGQMDEASRRAEKLAPNLWFGHAARGAYYIGTNQWLAADQAFQRALATGARDPDMVGNVGSFPQQVGRYKASLPFDELLVELDPYNPGRLARKDRLIYARDFKGAWQAFKEDARPEPGAVLGFSETMWALSEGDLEAAKPSLRSLGTGPNGETIADFLDSPATDLQFIRRILDPPAGSKNAERWTYIYRALVAGHLGDTDLALEFLSRAYLGPGWAGHFPIWYPQLAETRRTEGFKTFVRDLGMVELWRASGDWGDFCRPLGTDDFECS
jgi:TolB-like protein